MTSTLTAAELRAELARIIEALSILSPSSFTFAGRSSKGVFQPVWGVNVSPTAPALTSELIQQLYQNCFSNRFQGVAVETVVPGTFDDREWVEMLSQANQSRDKWEDGWNIVSNMANGQVLAQRGATSRRLSPGEFINVTSPGMLPTAGASLRVYSPRESRTLQPGFYYVFGETPQEASDEFSTGRFYWNVSVDGGPQLVRSLSEELNRWQIPFRFKIVNHRDMFARSDTAVLYVPRRYVHISAEISMDIHKVIRIRLRDDVPLFTKRLYSGLAFAEDPGTSESFGMSRCRLLAEAIWAAYTQGATQTEERVNIVEQYFKSRGISLLQPWLNAGSAADFGFGVQESWLA